VLVEDEDGDYAVVSKPKMLDASVVRCKWGCCRVALRLVAVAGVDGWSGGRRARGDLDGAMTDGRTDR
jgi:hypothetical protein